MKKIFVIVGIVLISTGAFAQVPVSLSGHLSLYGSSASPGIGVGIDVGPVDILAELDFGMSRFNDYIGDPDESTETSWYLRFYAGVAPKVEVTEKLTLTLPILLKFTHYASGLEFKNNYYSPGIKELSYNSFGLDLGARAYYALSKSWSVFAGFQVAAITYRGEVKGKAWNSGGYIFNITDNSSEMYILDSGSIDLGIKFTF